LEVNEVWRGPAKEELAEAVWGPSPNDFDTGGREKERREWEAKPFVPSSSTVTPAKG
jgi:hypothetical protein